MKQFKYGGAYHCTIDSPDGSVVVGDEKLFEYVDVAFVGDDLEKMEQHVLESVNEQAALFPNARIDREALDGDDSLIGNDVCEAGKLVSVIKYTSGGEDFIYVAFFTNPPMPSVIE